MNKQNRAYFKPQHFYQEYSKTTAQRKICRDRPTRLTYLKQVIKGVSVKFTGE